MSDKKDNLAVFRNTKKTDHPDPSQTESWPDYNVVIEIGGVDYEAGLWLRESNSGLKYMSGLIKPKWVKPASSSDEPSGKQDDTPKQDDQFDDDVPF